MGIHSFPSVFYIEKSHNTKTLILHKFQAISQKKKNPKKEKKKSTEDFWDTGLDLNKKFIHT